MIQPDHTEEIHAYLGGICNHLGCQSLGVGGIEDHVHLLISLNKTLSVAQLMQPLKRDSSLWIKKRFDDAGAFKWQDGYFAVSVGQSQKSQVQRYVAGQRAHHARMSFQDEVCLLMKKYEVALDERYAWD